MLKNILLIIFSLVIAGSGGYFAYTNFQEQPILAGEFACGLILGIIIMNIWINIKNNKINIYKRALEKEAISSSESSSKVKVLESKIQVLEKALENALKK